MPTCAIFADTQAEPKSVYDYLAWLEKHLPFPVYRVTNGSLTERITTTRTNQKTGKEYYSNMIPAFVQTRKVIWVCAKCSKRVTRSICEECGSNEAKKIEVLGKGIIGRSCTYTFKLTPLYKKEREIGRIKRGQKTVGVISWIGISLDEATRMKPSRNKWSRNIYPLVDRGMKRHDCLRWMAAKGFPTPPRSACSYCPFHSDVEWRRLRDHEPEEFAKAVQVEKQLQACHAKIKTYRRMQGTAFLHDSLKPLDQVDFSTDEDHGQQLMFQNECEGMCGV